MSKKNKSIITITILIIIILVAQLCHWILYAIKYNARFNYVEDRIVIMENRVDTIEDRVNDIKTNLPLAT